MPQREFWTTAHPTRVTLTFAINAIDPDADPQGTIKVEDQSGKIMEWGGGSIPQGFAAWAFADACRAAMEGFELGGAGDCKRAFGRVLAQWRRDAKAINSPSGPRRLG